MSEYKELQEVKDTQRTLDILEKLPFFCTIFYDGRQMRLSAKTQLDYANKMKVFLCFLHENISGYKEKEIKDYTLDDLANVTPEIARNFVTYLSTKYKNPQRLRRNQKTTADNYVACISSYYAYFIKIRSRLSNGNDFIFNPFTTIDRVKRKHKEIIYMDKNAQDQFLNSVKTGEGLSGRKLVYHKKTRVRERCLCEILLDTGIRVSELVGIDIEDINMEKCSIFIKRKGDKEDTVYFSDNTKELIEEYLLTRSEYSPRNEERAMFLSSNAGNKGARLSVRSVERIIKKYAVASSIPKGHQITPHKLRSSFAMETLRLSGNIALVQKALGHENIVTTTIYAQAQDKDKEEIRNIRHQSEI